MPRALVRAVPDSFGDALASRPRRISVAKARAQHARYVDALRALCDEVATVPADEAHPDCPFVEDQAVVIGGRALLTVPGHPSRRGERPAVKEALVSWGLPVIEMALPATLDGGDVLVCGGTVYVGRSTRSNGEGLAILAASYRRPVVPVPVAQLHLKSVASAVGDRLVLVAAETVDPTVFAGAEVVVVPPEEAAAANVVCVGRTVVMQAGCPITKGALVHRGFDVVELGLSEFRKADGAMTCLSVLVGSDA